MKSELSVNEAFTTHLNFIQFLELIKHRVTYTNLMSINTYNQFFANLKYKSTILNHVKPWQHTIFWFYQFQPLLVQTPVPLLKYLQKFFMIKLMYQ